MLEPLRMMFVCPFFVVSDPPLALMPAMVLVPVAVLGPLRMVGPDPIRMILIPPGAGMPHVMLVVGAHARMLLGMDQGRHARREKSRYHRAGHQCPQFHD